MYIISFNTCGKKIKKDSNSSLTKLKSKKISINKLLTLLTLILTIALLSSCSFIEDILNNGKPNNPEEDNPYILIDEWKLNYPVWGITSDIDSNIYAIIDEGNSYYMYKYDESGTFLNKWYISSTYSGDISAWTKVILTQDSVIKSYYPNGTFISDYNVTLIPWALLAGKDGNTYVIGYDYNSSDLPLIRKYSSTGALLEEWEVSIDGSVASLDISSDSSNNILVLYLTYIDSYKAGVMVYSPDGDLIKEWGVSNFPYYFACDDKNYSYIVCHKYVNNKDYFSVRKFNNSGDLVNEWEIPAYPNGITVTENGNVYISIYNSGTGYQSILVFSNKK